MKFLDRLLTAVAGAVVGAAVATQVIGPALALVFPGQYAPRYFPTQQTHYERHVINITQASATLTGVQADGVGNTCQFLTAGGNCSIRIGALPYNAFVVRAALQVTTACNGVTTCTVSLGTSTASPANLLAAQSILSAAGSGVLVPAVAATAGIVSTGNNILASGADGGFDLFANITESGGGATTGTVVVILEYYGPNDGGCLPNVPMASTAGPC